VIRAVVLFFTLIINLILQSTVFGYIEIIGIRPNTAILIVVSYAILRGDTEGAAAGFFAGLLQDIFFGGVIGMNALIYMLIGYACGKPFKDFFHETLFFPLLLGSLSVFLYSLVFYFLNFMLRGKLDFFYYFRKIILPETVYTVVLTTPVYRFVYAVNNRIERRENKRRMLFREDSKQ